MCYLYAHGTVGLGIAAERNSFSSTLTRRITDRAAQRAQRTCTVPLGVSSAHIHRRAEGQTHCDAPRVGGIGGIYISITTQWRHLRICAAFRASSRPSQAPASLLHGAFGSGSVDCINTRIARSRSRSQARESKSYARAPARGLRTASTRSSCLRAAGQSY